MGVSIDRGEMAHWTILCAERYLSVFYDYLHEKMYDYHVLQADETPVLVSKENRTSGSRHYMWYIVPVRCIRTNQSCCMNINPLEMQIIQEYS